MTKARKELITIAGETTSLSSLTMRGNFLGEANKIMRVILLHDWLTGFRGGERVLELFCQMFPDAPIYTLIHKEGSVGNVIESHTINTSFLSGVPGIAKHYRKFLPLFPTAAGSLVLPKCDLVLSSSHCVIKGVVKPAGSVHVSYIHSPMRYLYDQFDSYFGAGAPAYQRMGMAFFRKYLTNWDLASNANVDMMIANSGFVKERIKTYYGVESRVIHPFVELDDFRAHANDPLVRDDYYTMVTAFAPNKRVDLAIKAFNKLGLKLKIIGSGQKESELRAMAKDNIHFLGNVDREEVIRVLRGARALIFPGVEDFGITPLEALAAGTPVIAFRAGGVLETLNDEVASFFDEPTVESLAMEVIRSQDKKFDKAALWNRAEIFSKENFVAKMQGAISDALK